MRKRVFDVLHDALIIGGGHNGLVSAVVLARAGLDVVVVEANETPGGCIWTETLPTGHRLERGAIDHTSFKSMAEDLGLYGFGLEFVESETMVGAGFGDGTTLQFVNDLDQTLDSLSGPRAKDRDGYRDLSRLGGSLFSLLDSFNGPPRLDQIASMGANLDVDPFRLMVTSSQKLLSEYLSDPHLRSVIEMYGAHAQLPPWLPGSGMFAFLLPAGHGQPSVRPLGGSVALVSALVAALENAGGHLVTSQRVTTITPTADGGIVDTEAGGRFEAKSIVSTVDINTTDRMLATGSIRPDRGLLSTAALNVAELKVDLALSRPATPGFDGDPRALWMLQEEPNSLSRSFGQIVAGQMPDQSAMMWGSPSAMDPSAAPPGQGTAWLSAVVPARVEGGWNVESEASAAERLLDGFARITGTDIRSDVVDMRVSGPATWRERIGTPFGNPNHLDLTLDQMFNWRHPAARPYRTSIPWLYLSGAGTFPGGGLSGIPGRNAALAVLEDSGRSVRRRGGLRRDIAAMRTGWSLFRQMRKRN